MNDITGWQPIETAPKDKRILLLLPTIVVCGWWNTTEFARNPNPYWTNDREAGLGRRWARDNQPTHWMPLPIAPEKTP